MSNVKTKPVAYFLLTLFLVIFAVVSTVTESQIADPFSAVKTAYKTIPVLLAVYLLFSIYAWRWRIFQGWLVPFPNIEGTWQGTIQTTWKDPVTGEVPGSIPTILTIKQSYSCITCVMKTAEMTSRSYFADFWIDKEEQIRKLGYCYISTPLVGVRDRSQPHEGTVELEIIGNPVDRLRGVYWTTRKTTGEVALTFRCKELLTDYPEDLGDHPMQN